MRHCVGQPLADDPAKRFNRPLAIIEAVGLAVGIAKIELRQIAVKITALGTAFVAAQALAVLEYVGLKKARLEV